jgi:hypothetical protein
MAQERKPYTSYAAYALMLSRTSLDIPADLFHVPHDAFAICLPVAAALPAGLARGVDGDSVDPVSSRSRKATESLLGDGDRHGHGMAHRGHIELVPGDRSNRHA